LALSALLGTFLNSWLGCFSLEEALLKVTWVWVRPEISRIAINATLDIFLNEFSRSDHCIEWSWAHSADDLRTKVDSSVTCADITVSLETASLYFLSRHFRGTEALLCGVSSDISELIIRARNIAEHMLLYEWELNHLFKVQFWLLTVIWFSIFW
jgi:hypothetical protein